MRVLFALVALALAGCAGSGSDAGPSGPAAQPRLTPDHPPLAEYALLDTGFVLSTADPRAEFPVVVPNGTTKVLLKLRLDSGAFAGLRVALRECTLDVAGPAPATGQELTKDCGALIEGEDALVVRHAGGELRGGVVVTAHVCTRPEAAGGTTCPKGA